MYASIMGNWYLISLKFNFWDGIEYKIELFFLRVEEVGVLIY